MYHRLVRKTFYNARSRRCLVSPRARRAARADSPGWYPTRGALPTQLNESAMLELAQYQCVQNSKLLFQQISRKRRFAVKHFNYFAWSSLLLAGLMIGCSETDAPATGGAMMTDAAMQGGSMTKDGDMMQGGDMKSAGMMKDDKMMKEDGR